MVQVKSAHTDRNIPPEDSGEGVAPERKDMAYDFPLGWHVVFMSFQFHASRTMESPSTRRLAHCVSRVSLEEHLHEADVKVLSDPAYLCVSGKNMRPSRGLSWLLVAVYSGQ